MPPCPVACGPPTDLPPTSHPTWSTERERTAEPLRHPRSAHGGRARLAARDLGRGGVHHAPSRRCSRRAGARIAVVGCGTSWFMAQSYAWLRETGGHGETDAFAASEAFVDRGYDAVVALTRSGTTTEVLELVERLRGRVRTIGVIGDPTSPARRPRRRRGDPAVRRRAVGRADPLRDHRARALPRLARRGPRRRRRRRRSRAIDDDLDPALVDAEQFTFLGRGWTVGLAHEAALKMREASQSWTESYPAMEYRHGPIAIAAPGRVTWHFGAPPAGLAARGRRDRRALRGGHARPDGRARARAARRARAGAAPRASTPTSRATSPAPSSSRADRRDHDPDAAPAPLGPGDVVLAFDVGGTDTKSALVDADGRVLGLTRTPTPLDGERTADARRRARSPSSPRHLRDAHPGVQPVAAGLLVPGIVDDRARRRRLREQPRLARRADPRPRRGGARPAGRVRPRRARRRATPSTGSAPRARYGDVVVLVIGTGIAGSLILDGRPHLGGGYAGEIGHSLVDPDGAACPCGAIGMPRDDRLGRRDRPALRGSAPATPSPGAREVLAARAGRRPDAAARVGRRASTASPSALAQLVATVAPEAIVIGGGLAQAGAALFEPLDDAARRTAQLPPPPAARARRSSATTPGCSAPRARRRAICAAGDRREGVAHDPHRHAESGARPHLARRPARARCDPPGADRRVAGRRQGPERRPGAARGQGTTCSRSPRSAARPATSSRADLDGSGTRRIDSSARLGATRRSVAIVDDASGETTRPQRGRRGRSRAAEAAAARRSGSSSWAARARAVAICGSLPPGFGADDARRRSSPELVGRTASRSSSTRAAPASSPRPAPARDALKPNRDELADGDRPSPTRSTAPRVLLDLGARLVRRLARRRRARSCSARRARPSRARLPRAAARQRDRRRRRRRRRDRGRPRRPATTSASSTRCRRRRPHPTSPAARPRGRRRRAHAARGRALPRPRRTRRPRSSSPPDRRGTPHDAHPHPHASSTRRAPRRRGIGAFNVVHLETAEALVGAAEDAGPAGHPADLRELRRATTARSTRSPSRRSPSPRRRRRRVAVHLDHAEDPELAAARDRPRLRLGHVRRRAARLRRERRDHPPGGRARARRRRARRGRARRDRRQGRRPRARRAHRPRRGGAVRRRDRRRRARGRRRARRTR